MSWHGIDYWRLFFSQRAYLLCNALVERIPTARLIVNRIEGFHTKISYFPPDGIHRRMYKSTKVGRRILKCCLFQYCMCLSCDIFPATWRKPHNNDCRRCFHASSSRRSNLLVVVKRVARLVSNGSC